MCPVVFAGTESCATLLNTPLLRCAIYVAQHSVVEICNRNVCQSVRTTLCNPYAVQDVQSTLLNTPLLRCAIATQASPSGRNCVAPHFECGVASPQAHQSGRTAHPLVNISYISRIKIHKFAAITR
jgi:hypothetical protein